MTTSAIAPAPSSAADGFWTIQIIQQNRAETGRRYVCRAADDMEARSIAMLLAGSARTVVGYDYFRFDNPAGVHALTLDIGQSERVESPEAWSAFESARQGG